MLTPTKIHNKSAILIIQIHRLTINQIFLTLFHIYSLKKKIIKTLQIRGILIKLVSKMCAQIAEFHHLQKQEMQLVLDKQELAAAFYLQLAYVVQFHFLSKTAMILKYFVADAIKLDIGFKCEYNLCLQSYTQIIFRNLILQRFIISDLQIRQMFKKVDNQDIIEEELPDGSIKRYLKGKLLGKGGFAKCYEFTSLQTQKKYAAKVIDKASLQKSKAKQKLSSQIKIHKSMNNRYVVKFQHFFQDTEYVYILLQKCSNQTLNEILKRRRRMTDIQTKYYIYQLAVALEYIHKQMVIHRDLKLGNLFLSDKLEIKLGDFGLAAKLDSHKERRKTKCGTPNYIAPQILDDSKAHSYQVDIWSLGVITYTLLVGRPPFESNDIKTTYNRIKTCNYIFPDSSSLSETSKNFISKMLQLDPSKRPTIDQVLVDPFLNTNSIPQSLPLSTLACPPSYDFLKKYRDAQQTIKIQKQMQNISNLDISHEKNRQESCKKIYEKSQNIKNSQSRYKNAKIQAESKQKSNLNRVFSAANINTQRKVKQINLENNGSEFQKKSQKIWVTYYQQNNKFGLGYILNSNVCGFRYNDATCMISNFRKTQIKYTQWDKKQQPQSGNIYTYSQAQQVYTKKYKILSHFDRQLRKVKQDQQQKLPNNMRIKLQKLKYRENQQTQMKFYVTRYHITNKSIIFWFNVPAYQIIFEDKSELLFSEHKIITYVNKFGERIYFHEKDRDKQSDDIKKRIKHLFTVINNRITKKTQQNIGDVPQKTERQKNQANTLKRNHSNIQLKHKESLKNLDNVKLKKNLSSKNLIKNKAV